MRNSELRKTRLLALATAFAAIAAASSGCGTYGDPCLRTTDCGSGFVCVEGKCQVDLGDNPSDAATIGDAVVTTDAPSSGDGTTPDVSRDASTDTSIPEGTVPPPDSSDVSDAPRESAADGDAAETSLFDVPRETSIADNGSLPDAADARVSTDSDGGNRDAATADVSADADSGGVIDVTVDAFDAAG